MARVGDGGRTSGAIQCGVPMTVWVMSWKLVAMPKSASFTCAEAVSSTFAALTSLCTVLCSRCKYFSATSTSVQTAPTSSAPSGPCCRTTPRSEPAWLGSSEGLGSGLCGFGFEFGFGIG